MEAAIKTVEDAIRVLGRDPWSADEKVSDEFLPNVFKRYFESIRGDNRLDKSDFHILAEFIEPDEIDSEIKDALDLLVTTSKRAKPKC